MKKAFLALAVLVLAVAQAGRADDLYNDLSGATADSNSVGDDSGPLADSFSTGSSAFDLTTLNVLLQGNGSSSSNITAYLLTNDASGSDFPIPGTTLEEIGSQTVNGSVAGAQLITFSTAYLLDPNTRYWIELTSNNDAVSWDWTADTSGVGVESEYLALQYGLGSWVSGPNDPYGPFQMEVAGVVATPEPSTILMTLLGLAALMGFALRKNKVLPSQLA